MSGRMIYYSIVRVVPDPARGERLNVGAIAWDPAVNSGAICFAPFRTRLRALGMSDVSAVEEFRDWIRDAIDAPTDKLFVPGARAADSRWDIDAMRRASQWGGLLQLSDIRPSRGESARAVAEIVCDRAVRTRESQAQPETGKDRVRRRVADDVREAILARLPKSGDTEHPLTVKTRIDVRGKKKGHNFDVAIMNGAVAGAIITPNFENPKVADVVRDLEAATWGVIDVSDAREAAVRFAIATPTSVTTDDRVREAFDVLVAEGATPFIGDPRAWRRWAAEVAVAAVASHD